MRDKGTCYFSLYILFFFFQDQIVHYLAHYKVKTSSYLIYFPKICKS